MKNLTQILKVFIVIFLSVISFGSVAYADYFATTTLTTSGSFVVPLGVTNLTISISGAGGGGGGGAFTYGGGGGGSGSSISNINMSVTPGQVIPFTIGIGGTGGSSGSFSSSGGNGGNGGATFFGSSISANGGNGGYGAIVNGGGGQGGTAGGIGGTNGTNGDSTFGERHYGGNGGTNPFGVGGVRGYGDSGSYILPTAGVNGNGGGGGSGWALYAAGTDAGANGGDGVVIVSYTADLTAPVITMNGSSTINIFIGGTYSDLGATALDNVDGNVTAGIVTFGLPINTSATGTQFVIYSSTDSAGNIATAIRTVNVISLPATDNVAPVITITGGTPTTIFQNSTYSDLGATAFDNIDGTTTVSIILNNVNTSVIGTYSVIYSATDIAGNNATATRAVNVIAPAIDLAPPVIMITGGTPTTVLASSVYSDQGALAYDAFDDATTTASIIFNDVTTSATGTYSVIYFATDIAGNIATATRMVNVVDATSTDNIPPVITLISGTPVTITIGSVYIDSGATAFDNVDGDVTANIATSTDLNNSVVGVYTYVYTVSDVAGNVASTSRYINVIAAGVDNTAPVITITGGTPTTIFQNSTYSDLGATAFDNIDGTTTVSIILNNVNTSVIGTYSVIYSATDIAGNNATATRAVNVIAPDTIAPVITILGSNPMNIVRTISYVEAGAVAVDNFDGLVSVSISGTVNVNATGTYQIIYSATDSSGNAASSTRVVNVVDDNIPPVITILGLNPASLAVGGTYSDLGATAFDNIDGTTTASIFSNNVNASVAGTYSVVYLAVDLAGNSTTSTRVVNVTAPDLTAPVITILGLNPVSVLINSVYVDAGATAFDAVDGNVTTNISTSSDLNISATGTYSIIYTVSDIAGNISSSTRTINVVAVADTIAPVITILGSNPVTLTVGDVYTDAGATALDNVDGNITANIIATSSVNNSLVGNYFVVYSVTDGAGNGASSTRIVNVVLAPTSPVGGVGGGGGGGAPIINGLWNGMYSLGQGNMGSSTTASSTNSSPAPVFVSTSTISKQENRTVVHLAKNLNIETNEIVKQQENGLQIPSGVGQLNSENYIAGNVLSTTSTSTASTTNNTGFVATVFAGFASIPKKAVAGILFVSVSSMLGLLYYKRF